MLNGRNLPIATIVLLFLLANGAFADDTSAFKDWSEGRREEALTEWRRLADDGDALAQYNLGTRYLQGDGVHQSREAAVLWLEKSAEGGSVHSMELLGTLLMEGNGFKTDYQHAIKLLSVAAQTGSVVAKNNLAVMYMQGLGVPVDLPRAHRYAAEAGTGENAPPSKLLAEIERRMSQQQGAEIEAGLKIAPPAPATATASPAVPAARPEKGWFAHIASVANQAEARREWRRQQKLFPGLANSDPLYVDARLSSGAQVTRIFVGGFADRESAKSFCGELKGGNCLVVRSPDYR